jgi:Kinesin motor domain
LWVGAFPGSSACVLTWAVVAAPQMNRESSRSHLIMSIVVESTNLQTQNVTKGKLSFVDLAGSER